ncbi:hypothetical protein [Okeania sp. SIO2B3]|uniref:hypothetical protein n=1 Tax=Okeania sp. SIO2B3 TaxID=2607784 RepID=UPI0013C20CD6|nr:hypothetical protein [Okeania sp. SIO2B3]NET44930.1 hypothetical protein [Okeania sp. SIO2B3]
MTSSPGKSEMIPGVLKAAFLIEAIANQEKSHKLSFCEASKKLPRFFVLHSPNNSDTVVVLGSIRT